MNASIRKEVRSLLPAVIVTVLLTVGIISIDIGRATPELLGAVYVFGYLLIGATVMGREFQTQTMGMLLAQPRRLKAIWNEKMLTLGMALALVCAVDLLAIFAIGYSHVGAAPDLFRQFAYIACAVMAVGIAVFCTAPFATLATRSVLGGVVLSLAMPLVIWLFVVLLAWVMSLFASDPDRFLNAVFHRDKTLYIAGIGAFYCLAMYWLGYRRFMRLEVTDGPGREIKLPVRMEGLLGRLSKRLMPGYTSPTASLIRKELQLQRVAFIVAGLACVLLAGESVAWKLAQDEATTSLLAGTFAVYVVLIPLLAGSLCVAEERNWGVAEWQLVLPTSAAKQGLIKLLATFVICAFLGVVIPLLLLTAGRHWFGMQITNFEWDWVIAGHVYLVVFSIVVYASSKSRNTLRAIIYSMALMAVVAAICALIIFVVLFNVIIGLVLSPLLENMEIQWVREVSIIALCWILAGLFWIGAYRNMRKPELHAKLLPV